MLLWTGCADNAYMGDNEEATKGVKGAIAFGSSFQAVTRAETGGAAAADVLGNTFIVNGFKFAGETRQDVFRDYTVSWETNSAGTTLTNTSGWDYAGIDNAFADPTYEQTVKYWDWSQDYYNFAAYSVGKGNTLEVKNSDIKAGDYPTANTVYVSPFKYSELTGWPYFLRGNRDDLLECYITDLNTIPQANFGNEVKLKFLSFAAKVRLAFYETIPGYSIKDLRFYESNGSSIDEAHTYTSTNAQLFATNIAANKGTYKIFYPHVGSENVSDPDYNKVHVGHEPGGAVTYDNQLDLGAMNYSGRENLEPDGDYYLGRTANTATFSGDEAKDYYTKVIPYEGQTVDMEMWVDYTLVSTDITGETINVYGARAIIPSIYARWRPNCAYTYIFKIADNSNGWTSPYVSTAGLYPITFDAVYVNDENNQQTTISTISAPSVTSYQKGHQYNITDTYPLPSASTADDDDIYIQVMNVDTKNLLDLTDENSKFYSVTKADDEDPDPTEILVTNALNVPASETSGTIVGVNGLTLTPSTIDNNITVIPGAFGPISVDAHKAAKVTPAAAGTYAYVYDTRTYYPATAVILSEEPAGWPTSWYTDSGFNTLAPTTFEAGTYYQKLKVYGVKVIKVKE